jgi:hypothetical protein
VAFVALDGEGINEKYCLLQDSEGGKLFRLAGLQTKPVFDWLLHRRFELRNLVPVFVGYVTTYDVNMILRDVDDDTLRKIFATDDKQFVRWNEYEILYIPRKVFKLRRRNERNDGLDSFTWYDVFTYFGGSFVNACRGFLGRVPREIVAGKKQRSKFRISQLKTIERYNQLEVELLVKLCDRMNEIFTSQGIALKKWHGPGAVAEFVLGKKMLNIHQDYPVFHQDQVFPSLFEAWDCAYYGGRFENMGIGTFRDVHTYDINSAYPYALSMLPILTFGSEWETVLHPRLRSEQMSVYLVEWNVSKRAPFGPFPWRDGQGRIFYPLNGLGWYWKPEVAAALEMFGSAIKLHKVWFLKQGEPSRFGKEIPRLYELRKRLKKEGNPGEYAIKIALNSIYGKLAQRVGISPFRCIPWAGWITSQSRAMLLRACMGREHSILAFATDSVFSRKVLPLGCSGNLGDWKAERADELLILMNGFYRMDDRTRKRKSATRGLPAVKDEKTTEDDVTWNDIISGLNKDQTYTYPFTQFVTHSMAIHFPNKFAKHRLKFIKTEKTLRPFEGTRRIFEEHRLSDWEHENAMSQPVVFPTNELSYPSTLEYASVTIEEEPEDENGIRGDAGI